MTDCSHSPLNIFSIDEFPSLSRENPSPRFSKTPMTPTTNYYAQEDYPFLSSNYNGYLSSSPLSTGSSTPQSPTSPNEHQFGYFTPVQVQLKIDTKPNSDQHVELMKQFYGKEDPSIADKKIKAGLERFNKAYAAIPCNPQAAFSHAPVYQNGMAPYFTGFH